MNIQQKKMTKFQEKLINKLHLSKASCKIEI